MITLIELCHNRYSDHDERFYAFFEELNQEFDQERKNGWQGEGFHAPGSRVGGDRRLTVQEAKCKAVEQAERRKRTSLLLGRGGRLGGLTPPSGNRNARELAAEVRTGVNAGRKKAFGHVSFQAAERRARDQKTCGHGKNIASILQATDLNSSIVDLTGLNDGAIEPPAGSSGKQEVIEIDDDHSAPRPPPDRSDVFSARPAAPRPAARELKRKRPDPEEVCQWTCSTCTLVNYRGTKCDACLNDRPSRGRVEGWTCHRVSRLAWFQCDAAESPPVLASREQSLEMVVFAMSRDQTVVLISVMPTAFIQTSPRWRSLTQKRGHAVFSA